MEMENEFDANYFADESKKWLTVLNELRTENIRLKELLSAAIRNDVSLDFVARAEQFQERFVDKDQLIDLLRHDINTARYGLSAAGMTQTEQRQYKILGKDIRQLVEEFRKMEQSFADFLRRTG